MLGGMRQELFASRSHALMLLSFPVVLFLAAAVQLAALGPRSPEPGLEDPANEVMRVLAVAGLGLAGFLIAVLAPGLVRRAPALVIDDEGLDERGALGAGRVPWSDVASVRVVRLARAYVGLELFDLDAFLEHAPLLRRLALRGAVRMGYPPITISGGALGVDTHELARAIAAARDAARAPG